MVASWHLVIVSDINVVPVVYECIRQHFDSSGMLFIKISSDSCSQHCSLFSKNYTALARMFEALELSMTGCYIFSRLRMQKKKYQKWYTIDAPGIFFAIKCIFAILTI